MKKRILAMALALIMLTGTSSLAVDASEDINGPVTVMETLAEFPMDEVENIEVQAAAEEAAPPEALSTAAVPKTTTEEPKLETDVAANTDTTTQKSESEETPAPKAEQVSEESSDQEKPEEDTKPETPVTPSDVQEEDEEVVEIEDEETPLAGPAPLAEGPSVFSVTSDWTVEPLAENTLNISYNSKGENKHIVYVLPGADFYIKRNGGRHCWWRWFGLSQTKNIYAQVEVRDTDAIKNEGWKYAPYDESHDKNYWAGGQTENKFNPRVRIGENALVNTKVTLRSVDSGAAGSGVKNFPVNGLRATYTRISFPKDQFDTVIYVVQPATVKYMMNDGTGNSFGAEGTLGLTLGYTTTDASTSQKMTVMSAPNREDTGYRFIGWNTQPDGRGDPYSPGSTFQITGDMTLYAQWETDYTVNYYEDYRDGIAPVRTEQGTGVEGHAISYENKAEYTKENVTYHFQKVEGDTVIRAGAVLNVYYVSKANYTVNYYKDGKLVDTDVEKGEGKIKEKIPYDSQKYFGYTLRGEKPIEGRTEITVNDEENVLHVYYVKTSGDLVIKAGNEEQISVFEITDSNGFSMQVTVRGTSTIKNLPAGDYVVTELSGWTWRYMRSEAKTKTVTVAVNEAGVADFGQSLNLTKKRWYGVEASKVDNHFKESKAQREGGTTND